MSTVTHFARTRAAERASAVNQERARVLECPAEDQVHDLRVALRRMEQIFDLFDIEPLGFDVKQGRQQMKDWLRAAGKVRDCDVVMPLLHAPWTNDLLAYRQVRATELVETIVVDPMPGPHVRRYRRLALTGEVVQFARTILPRQAKIYFEAGAQAAAKHRSLKRLHQFRLHGKSLRYSLELFEPLYGPGLKGLSKILKRTQHTLGEMADARAGMKLVKEMNAPDAVVEPLHQLADEKRKAFAEKWGEEVPDENVGAKWVEYLRRYATTRSR
jgi:CHAD domain-containing protein